MSGRRILAPALTEYLRDDADAATVRIEARFKNARLYNAIVDDAVPPIADRPQTRALQAMKPIRWWCEFHELNVAAVYNLLNLRVSPWRWTEIDGRRTLTPRDICGRIASLLGRDVGYLFPADLYERTWPTLATDVDPRRVPLLENPQVLELPPTQETAIEQRELAGILRQTLDTLTPRERMVLTRRVGLDDDVALTLREIGELLDRSSHRVQQIEAKAMRKMRQPRRHGRLESFLAPRHGRRGPPIPAAPPDVIVTPIDVAPSEPPPVVVPPFDPRVPLVQELQRTAAAAQRLLTDTLLICAREQREMTDAERDPLRQLIAKGQRLRITINDLEQYPPRGRTE